MVWLWGSRAGSATTSTPVDKAMIPSIGPTRSVDRGKSGATDRLYRDTAWAAAAAFGSHSFRREQPTGWGSRLVYVAVGRHTEGRRLKIFQSREMIRRRRARKSGLFCVTRRLQSLAALLPR